MRSLGYVGQVKQVKILGALAVNDVSRAQTTQHSTTANRQGGETDWKVLAIDVNDPLAPLVDSERHSFRSPRVTLWCRTDRRLQRRRAIPARHHRRLQKLVDCKRLPPLTHQLLPSSASAWAHAQYYKVARGDEVIPIVGGWYQNSSFTEQIVEESHGYWRDLVNGQVDSNSINYNQTLHPDFAASYVDPAATVQRFEIPEANELPAEPKPSRFNQWYYLLAGAELIEVPEAE